MSNCEKEGRKHERIKRETRKLEDGMMDIGTWGDRCSIQ